MSGRPPQTWEMFAREMGVLIQQARIEAGFTQEDLAHQAGLTRTHYQQIERGWWKRGQPANPSIKVLVALTETLGVDIAAVLPDASALEDVGPDR